jgi:hypothetical protein
MPNLPTTIGLALAALLAALPATAAEFAVKDLSGEQYCLPEAFWEALQASFPSVSRCSPHPTGTIEVVITPEAAELPVECHDDGAGGSFCMYAADIYLAAQYQGRWYAKTTSHAWTPVDDLAQLPAASHWAPWGGTGSLGFQFHVHPIDLNTSQFVPLPEGAEVYVGIAPAGSRSFTPKTVTKIHPTPAP